jgi:peptidoglycan/LPS O-acetylase OafA/YrhL
MQWTWTLECDLQLFLVIPFLVMIYQKIPLKFFVSLITALMFGGIYTSYWIADHYKLTAGVFSMNNHYMLSMWMMKPYCKIHLFSLGILSAILYEEIKKGKVQKSKSWAPHILVILGLVGMYFSAMIAFPRQMDPFGWSFNATGWYYALSRFFWALGWMIIFFYVVLGYSPLCKAAMQNTKTNFLGHLVYPCYLIAPLVYMNMYCTTQESIYMTMIGNIILGMGAMTFTFIVVPIYIFVIEYPIENVMNRTFRKIVNLKSK